MRVTSRPLVIGVGNPDRGDDAVGRVVARQLMATAAPDFDVIECSGAATTLLECFTGRECVIIVDACVARERAGEILRYDASVSALPTDFQTPSTHGIGVAAAIELARALDQLPRRMIIFAVVGQHFEIGAAMTSAVCAAVESVSTLITSTELATCTASEFAGMG